jgi:23S rRNA (pseudouridine1915-N3)-methyltransferase
MKLTVFYVESSKEDWATSAQEVYQEKLSRFCQFEIIKIKSPSAGRESKDYKVGEESKMILSKLKEEDFFILMDEHGKPHDTQSFAQLLSRQEELPKRTVFLIGGAFGVSEEIKARANAKISLSTMVMNHHVALTVLLEQMYRGFTILKKIPYHNS